MGVRRPTYKGGHLHEHLREEQLEQVGREADGDKWANFRTISWVKRPGLAEGLAVKGEGEKKEGIKEDSFWGHELQGGCRLGAAIY